MVRRFRGMCFLVVLVIASVILSSLVTSLSYAEKAKVTILWRDDPDEVPVLDEIIKDFNSTHPNITVEAIVVPYDEYDPKLFSMWAAGTPPDIFWCAAESGYVDHAIRDMNFTLDTLVNRDKNVINIKDFYPAAIEGATFRGDLKGLPFAQAYTAIFYNATLFDDAGIKYPTTNWTDKNWTWDKLVGIAKKLTKDINGDGKIDQYGLLDTRDLFEMAWAWGGDMFDPNVYKGYPPEKLTLDKPKNYNALLTALQKRVDLVYKDKVSPTPATQQVIEQMGPPLKTGRLGMVISGDWSIWGAMPKNYKWGIGAVPYSVPNVKKVCLYTDPLEIARTSKHPNEAWEFIKYLASPSAQKKLMEKTSRISSRQSLRKNYIEKISPLMVNTKQGLDQVLSGAFKYCQEDAEHTVFGFYKLQSVWTSETDPLWLGKKGVKEVLDTMIVKVNQAIEENLKGIVVR
ncbi:MAG: sugar ABC transporter substrate-binding protein [Dictyoglomi bacterium]|nr:sugar ABC transporter substrate-binding protein [Dictyoglomota bacterium]